MSRSRNHVFRSNADIFSTADIERSIEKEEFAVAFPTGNYEGPNTPIEFNVNSDHLHYINLHDSELRLNVSLKKKDGTAIENTVQLGCVNNLLDSLFSNVEIFINGQPIQNNSAYHPFASYFQKILKLGDKYFTSFSSGLFLKDAFPNIANNENNPDFKVRADLIRSDTGVNLIGRIQHCIFDQDVLLPNHVSIKIVLRKSSPEFVLFGSGTLNASDYKLTFSSATLHYKRVLLDEELVKYHQKLFNQNRTADYDIVKKEIKTIPIAANSVTSLSDSLYNGTLPNTIVVALVKSKGLNGEIVDNPYYFNNYSVSQLNLKIDKESFTYRNIDVDFANNFEHLYHTFLKSVCPHNENVITKEQFKESYCFYFFSLYPSKIRGYRQLPKVGNIRLEVKFATANTSPLTAILYSETDAELHIDKYGNIEST